MTSPPKWYLPVTITALVWNFLGCAAYLGDVMLTPEDVALMSPAQQSLYASRTWWSVSATAIAVWCGAAGSLGLVLRRRWGKPLLIASLTGIIIQDLGLLFFTDAGSAAGPVGIGLQGLVLVIAAGLVLLAVTAGSRGWIPGRTTAQQG